MNPRDAGTPNSRPWTILGVPIDSVSAPVGGEPFGTELATAALRGLGLVARLGGRDTGDLDARVVAPALGPARDPLSGIVGWPSVGTMTSTVRAAVAALVGAGERPFVLGGCCALVMGAAAGTRDALGRIGLANVDGHVDLYDHRTSPTGEAADLPVAALLGIGWPALLATLGDGPVLLPGDVVVIGARDEDERADLGDLPQRLGVTVHPPEAITSDPIALGSAAAAQLSADGRPFWLHLDLDVLDEVVFPATDYLMPNGLDFGQLRDVLGPLGRSRALAGVSVGCYNPTKDPDGRYGTALTDLLVDVFGPAATATAP